MAEELSISDVAERTGLSVHTIRYYEKEGLFVDPVRRTAAGRRVYQQDDVDWLTVCTVLRSAGMPIPEIRRYLELVREGPGTEVERLGLMLAQRDRVREQQAALGRCLDLIEYKVAVYQDVVDRLPARTA